MSKQQIADFYGCEMQTVKRVLKDNNIVGRTHEERKLLMYPINRECFSKWDNEEDLFYYGLLLSDGCISDSGNVTISLQADDLHILDSLKNYLEVNNKVRVYTQSKSKIATFSFQDSVIANNLRLAGMEPRKSSNEQLPRTFDLNNIEMSRHFWRGYICGDGSVRMYKTPNLHIVGSIQICEGFRNFCSMVLGYKVNNKIIEQYKLSNGNSLCCFRVTGRKAKKVSLFIFENSKVFINRKMEDALNFKNWAPTSSIREVYGIKQTKSGKWQVYFRRYYGNSPKLFDNKDEAIKERLKLELEYYGYFKSYS